MSVLLGKGDGTFQAAVNYAADNLPLSIAVGDFNRDGKPDLAVAAGVIATYGTEYGYVSVLLNTCVK